MITAHRFKDHRVAVFGLGRSGRACCRSLAAGGAEVIAWDDRYAYGKEAWPEDLPITDLSQTGFEDIAAIVLSPGVPLTHPEPHWTVEKAKAANVEIIGDTEIFMREVAASGAVTICITGTNGKSTTTALIGHILQHAGRQTAIGGNIGIACLDLPPPTADQIYVLELSSYQIDLTPSLAPDVGILLNLSPDHLDRHGTMENYAAVKARLFARQSSGQTAIICLDDAWTSHIAQARPGAADYLTVSTMPDSLADIRIDAGRLAHIVDGETIAEIDISAFDHLRGRHNWQNAGAAYAACLAAGLVQAEIVAGMASFPGLEHRMQQIAHSGNTIFINDSKATNAEAAACALASFDTIYWIAGGRKKDGGIDALEQFFPKIQHAYLIGEAADEFAAILKPHCPISLSRSIDKAVAGAAAAASAVPGSAVVFSPACASFDQFSDFEERGRAFCGAVARLPGVTLTSGAPRTC